jgi:hypothetical protein
MQDGSLLPLRFAVCGLLFCFAFFAFFFFFALCALRFALCALRFALCALRFESSQAKPKPRSYGPICHLNINIKMAIFFL